MTEKISLNLTLEELEIIDKYIELNDDTRQLFDKIRSAYPKSPVEAAYKRVFGAYPMGEPFWIVFKKGYDASKVSETPQEPEDDEWTIEKLQEKNWYVDAKTLLKSKKPVEKQSKTLTDIVYRWWGEVFTTHSDWDMETSVDDLIDQVEQWLPKQKFGSSQNVLGDVDIVEGFNDCLNKIKRNLR